MEDPLDTWESPEPHRSLPGPGWPDRAPAPGRPQRWRDPDDHGDSEGGTLPGGGATAGVRALAALNPGRRGVRALAVLAVVVVLVAGFLAWRSRPQTDVVSPTPTPLLTVSSVALPPTAASAPPSATMLVIAVAGRVHHPGLVRLPPGSRVADALAAAGGALPGTDLSFVNLARKVVDGELIVIGATPPPGTPTGAAEPPGAPAGGIVDLNTATLADLETLPGIGPALAQRILDYRAQHGGFRSIDELRNVSGIGDAKFAAVKDLVTA